MNPAETRRTARADATQDAANPRFRRPSGDAATVRETLWNELLANGATPLYAGTYADTFAARIGGAK